MIRMRTALMAAKLRALKRAEIEQWTESRSFS
jgi:hypothetical protein